MQGSSYFKSESIFKISVFNVVKIVIVGRHFHVSSFGRLILTAFSARQARRACVHGAV